MNIRNAALKTGAAVGALLVAPAVALAARTGALGILDTILTIMNAIVPIIFALAFLYFLYGVAEYVTSAGENKKEATEKIVGGLVALFVMFSVYSLIGIVSATFGIQGDGSTTVELPKLPTR